MWPFRTTRQHIEALRKNALRRAEPRSADDDLFTSVAANVSDGTVQLRWQREKGGIDVFGLWMGRTVAYKLAADIVRAADALASKDAGVDITAQVNGKDGEDG